MASEWTVSMKDTFLAQWLALPPRENHQIQEKIQRLLQDPLPDGHVKKQLTHIDPRLYRIRSGDYRIFYTFQKPYISLLELSKRDEDTYDHAPKADTLGGLSGEMPALPSEPQSRAVKSQKRTPPSRHLPVGLDSDLLQRLKVPPEFHRALGEVKTEDELLDVDDVPEEIRLRIYQALFEQPFEELLQQKEYVADSVDDLLRYKDGDLLGFLLRLTPEQEKFVDWAVGATGPTLVKGGPGTGKSTVALYRVRTMLKALRRNGVESPRILFTTYTNALVAFSRQLLESLLGADACLVDVRTADSLAREVVQADGRLLGFVQPHELREMLQQAVSKARFEGSSLEQRAQAQTLQRLGLDYLLEEICTVIDARGLRNCDAYLAAARPGRKVALGPTQRRAIWAVRDVLQTVLAERKVMTWQQLRSEAAATVRDGRGPTAYDAVVIDEVQDLNPSLVEMLTRLTASPGGLFLTADANQSIFGSGFRWQDIHEILRFRGRTGILRTNHRSTEEIGEAARSYLADGVLEEEDVRTTYSHNGPIPALRIVASPQAEVDLLARFLRGATGALHLGTGGAAVFVPTERVGRQLSVDLTSHGTASNFMTGRDLDLDARCVKVMTLKSAKGLEFPVVAIGGFADASYPYIPADASPEERAERLSQERRTLYVAMTRAMRALLVVQPSGTTNPLLTGFSPELWNLDGVH